MRAPSNYGFYRQPRFSVNQLADYLSCATAEQRLNVLRKAKFPKRAPVIAYATGKQIICNFMARNTGDLSQLDDEAARLDTRRRREPEGWMRDELARNIEALAAFRDVFVRARMRRYRFLPGPVDLTMNQGGVRINTRLDVAITETNAEGVTYSGGCVMFVANTDLARRNIEARRRAVAAVIYWELELSNPNIEPLPRLCMSLDVFGGEVVRAAAAIDRFRSQVVHACEEAADRWPRVTPPAGYDGPDWT
jgi:hypothetical protein